MKLRLRRSRRAPTGADFPQVGLTETQFYYKLIIVVSHMKVPIQARGSRPISQSSMEGGEDTVHGARCSVRKGDVDQDILL